jgi:pimeloyl-ACP methyl ester carboxylesterase
MTEVAQQAGGDKTAIHPFHVNVPEAELTDLRKRQPATTGWDPARIARAWVVLMKRLYWENKVGLYNDADVSVPAAVSVFPGENYQAPRSWTERAYHNLIYYNKLDKGGHFAAWEQPQLFSTEVRAGLRPLRNRVQ